MWRILKFQDKKYWTITCFAAIMTFFQVITDLLVPLFLSAMIPLIAFGKNETIVNEILNKGIKILLWNLKFNDYNQAMIVLGTAMGICSVVGIIFGVLSTYLAAKSAVNISKLIRSNVFFKIYELSSSNLDKFGTSSLITRLTNDVNLIQTMTFMTVRVLIRAPFMFIGGLIFSLMTNQWLSISIAVLIPTILIAIFISVYHALPLFKMNQKNVDLLNTQSRENILGVRVIKSFNLEPNQRVKYAEVNNQWNLISTKAFVILSGLNPIVVFIVNLSVLVIFIVGFSVSDAGLIENSTNSSTLTDLSTFLQYQGYIVMGIMLTMMVLINFVRSRTPIKRINEVLNDISDIKFTHNGVDIEDGSITFENVNFKYHSSSEYILKDINFQIQSGQTVGIIGATGSGKTSLMNLIARLYEPETGQVIVGKKNVKDIDTQKLRDQVGYILQENILFSGTIRSNLLFGNENATDEQINFALDISCSKNFINRFSEGIDHHVEQRGKNLSGGQKQRLSIARTILRNPKIIILDDSTSALDAITDKTLRANIKQKLVGVTTIIVAQKILSIKDADQIFVIDKGTIVGKGAHKELLNNCITYKNIAESQMSVEELNNA